MLSLIVSIALIFAFLGFPLFFVGLIVLLVTVIKKTSKIPAIIIMIISILLIISGFVLGQIDIETLEKQEESETIMVEAESEVRTMIYSKYMSSMIGGNIKNLTVDFTTKKANGDDYILYGKYTIIDNYNDKYVGKFEISLEYVDTYDDGSVNFRKKSVNISNAIKEN